LAGDNFPKQTIPPQKSMRFATFDKDFRNFTREGLDLLLLS
jgi:hypothetical protein